MTIDKQTKINRMSIMDKLDKLYKLVFDEENVILLPTGIREEVFILFSSLKEDTEFLSQRMRLCGEKLNG